MRISYLSYLDKEGLEAGSYHYGNEIIIQIAIETHSEL